MRARAAAAPIAMPAMAPADSAVDPAGAGKGVAELPKVLVTPTLVTAKADAAELDAAARLTKTGESVVVVLAAVTVTSAALIAEIAESVAALPSAGATTRTNQVMLDACSARAAARRESAVVLTVTHVELTPSDTAIALPTAEKVFVVAAAAAAAELGTDTASVKTTRGTGVAVAALDDDELADGDGDAEAELLGDWLGEAAALGEGLADGVTDGDALGDALDDAVALTVALADGVTDGDTLDEEDALGEGLGDGVDDGDTLGVAATDGETGEALEDAVADDDTLGVAATEGEGLIDADGDGEIDKEAANGAPGPPLESVSV